MALLSPGITVPLFSEADIQAGPSKVMTTKPLPSLKPDEFS